MLWLKLIVQFLSVAFMAFCTMSKHIHCGFGVESYDKELEECMHNDNLIFVFGWTSEITEVLCNAGLVAGLTGAVWDSFSSLREGGCSAFATFWKAFFWGEEVETVDQKVVAALGFLLALFFAITTITLLAMGDGAPNVFHGCGYFIEFMCHTGILTAIVGLLYEIILGIVVCNPCPPITFVLGCQTNLETFGIADAIADDMDKDEENELFSHSKHLEAADPSPPPAKVIFY